jgi:hypothetical protein
MKQETLEEVAKSHAIYELENNYKPTKESFKLACKRSFIQGAKWQQEQSNCELSELLEENQQLKKWKEEAMTVFSQIDLQEIGALLNIKLGTSVSEQLLPKFIELLEQRNEMLKFVEYVEKTMPSESSLQEKAQQLIKKVKDNG